MVKMEEDLTSVWIVWSTTKGQKVRLMERGRIARVQAAAKVATFPTVLPLWVLMEMFWGHI